MADSTDPATSKVVRDDDKARYEIWWGDELAGFAAFRQRGGRTIFVHTEIGDEFGGKGLGSALAKGALDDVVRRGQLIVAVCPFIAAYLGKHPEYAEHVVNRDGGARRDDE